MRHMQKQLSRVLLCATMSAVGLTTPALARAAAGRPPADAPRDGQHDFDFEAGTWRIHLKKLLHPLTGFTTWIEFDGTSVTRRLWDGRANLEQFEATSPGGHVEGLTLRLYNSETR